MIGPTRSPAGLSGAEAEAQAQMAFGVDSSAYAGQQLSMFDDVLAAVSQRRCP